MPVTETAVMRLLDRDGTVGIEISSPETTTSLLRVFDLGGTCEVVVIDSPRAVIKAKFELSLEAMGLLDQALGILAQLRENASLEQLATAEDNGD